jgi:glutaredoxin 3
LDESEEPFVPVVEIYTKSFCPYCWRAKSLLESKGVAFKEIAVDFGGAEKEKMVERARGRTTVPQIFIGQEHIGGCDDLMALESDGRLDVLIAA